MTQQSDNGNGTTKKDPSQFLDAMTDEQHKMMEELLPWAQRTAQELDAQKRLSESEFEAANQAIETLMKRIMSRFPIDPDNQDILVYHMAVFLDPRQAGTNQEQRFNNAVIYLKSTDIKKHLNLLMNPPEADPDTSPAFVIDEHVHPVLQRTGYPVILSDEGTLEGAEIIMRLVSEEALDDYGMVTVYIELFQHFDDKRDAAKAWAFLPVAKTQKKLGLLFTPKETSDDETN